MTKAIHCSFCGKPDGKVLDLVLTRRGSKACICDECLEVCGSILRKSATAPAVETPKASYRVGHETSLPLSCSFCGNSQETVHRLISSPPGAITIYICDACVELCFRAISGVKTRPAMTIAAAIREWFRRKTGVHGTAIHHIG